MLSFGEVFFTEFCCGRLPQMAAMKKKQLLFISGISRPSLCRFDFDLNQSQGTKPISRNGYGPGC